LNLTERNLPEEYVGVPGW